MTSRLIPWGQPAPWFSVRAAVNPEFHFDTVAGRFIVLCFFGSAGHPVGGRVLAGFQAQTDDFDGQHAVFFGASVDPDDERTGRVGDRVGRQQYFWDFDRAVSRLYGAVGPADGGAEQVRPVTYVLDPRLRVLAALPVGDDPAAHVAEVMAVLRAQRAFPATAQAPVLVLDRIFEPAFCRGLIQYYDDRGGKPSGFMRDVGGKTVGLLDDRHKTRRDQELEDDGLRKACMHRIHDRLIPEVHKAFQFRATRMERYIVACYDAADGGHFRAHRDNTTKGTAHRRFAVSLILNTGEFAGGYLRFPEFGSHLYSAPAGGAVVFSCSLLHEATPVTTGRRYVFLPFLYDDAAARIREQNAGFVGP